MYFDNIFIVIWYSPKNNYSFYGALFGFLFPLAATIIDSLNVYGSITWANALKVQTDNTLILIIDTAPLWLGLFSRIGGIRQDALMAEKSIVKQKYENKTIELRQNEHRLTTVLDNTLDGIIAINDSGSITLANTAMEKLFGYTASELVGQNITMIMPESYRANFKRGMENYLKAGQFQVIGQIIKAEGKRKDGSFFPIELAVNRYFSEDRQFFIGNIRDITLRKKTEDDLINAKEALKR